MRISVLSILISVLIIPFAYAQDDPIQLKNASFEDFPIQGKSPRGWTDCGFPGETPPDVQPSGNPSFAFFDVIKEPQDGSTYLGLVVRDNETWEMVSQRLDVPLEPGKCYEFSLYIARSEFYVSPSRTTSTRTNYTTPATMRIWGGSGYCNKRELLDGTKEIINTRWLKYEFRFEPTERHTYILLEAFYKTPTLFPYNGNVLVDNASAIVPVPCDDEIPVATVEPTPEPEVQPQKDPEPVEDPFTTPNEEIAEKTGETAQEEDKLIAELDRKTIKKGQTIKIDKLFFQADSSQIMSESYPVLDEIFRFLNMNQDVVVEIGGHTNGNPPHEYCDRLSTQRAKAVADYLSNKGIDRGRLQFKGYGKRKPIASNVTYEGRRRNQRVEIKILSFDG
jgi:outer membrane protein OmpA-like peptidoglycan-associated protein